MSVWTCSGCGGIYAYGTWNCPTCARPLKYLSLSRDTTNAQPPYTVTTTTSDDIAKSAVAAERRRLRQQIAELRQVNWNDAGYYKAIADILALLGPEA